MPWGIEEQQVSRHAVVERAFSILALVGETVHRIAIARYARIAEKPRNVVVAREHPGARRMPILPVNGVGCSQLAMGWVGSWKFLGSSTESSASAPSNVIVALSLELHSEQPIGELSIIRRAGHVADWTGDFARAEGHAEPLARADRHRDAPFERSRREIS